MEGWQEKGKINKGSVKVLEANANPTENFIRAFAITLLFKVGQGAKKGVNRGLSFLPGEREPHSCGGFVFLVLLAILKGRTYSDYSWEHLLCSPRGREALSYPFCVSKSMGTPGDQQQPQAFD